MCGIAGLWDAEPAELAPVIERMLAVIAHRGPDGDGTFVEGAFALGHRRLSIIDLDDRASQPMLDGTGRYVLTFNGEIYNYIELRAELAALGVGFRTESDSEVLLAAYAAWGSDCLQRFNGMFAFAILDRLERRLFCARDRLGVKPLVFVHDGRRFAFASEHKALVAAGATSGELAPDAVYEYIARGSHERWAQLLRRGRVAPPRPRARAGRRRDAADVGLVAARHDARRRTQLRRLVRRDRRAPRRCRPAAASQRRARRGPPLGRPRLERDRRRGRRARPEARDVHRRFPGGVRERRAVVLAARRRPLRAHAARGRDRDRRAHRQLGPAAVAPRRADRRPQRLPPAARLRPGARARDEGRPRRTGRRRAFGGYLRHRILHQRRLLTSGPPGARAASAVELGPTRAARAAPHPPHLDEGAGRRPRPGVPRPRRRILPRGGAGGRACRRRARES